MSQDQYNGNSRLDMNVYGDDKTVFVSRKVVRFVLSSCESQNTILAKGKLQNAAKDYATQENCGRIPFNKLLCEVNNILEDIYGYKLVGLPPRLGFHTGPSHTSLGCNGNNTNENQHDDNLTNKASRFILLNTMRSLPELDDIRLSQSASLYRGVLLDEDDLRENLNSAATVGNTLSTRQDLVFKGLLTVFICIIVFSKNNILEQELLKYLSSYGVPTDGSKIPILEWTIDELVKTLDRREYIVRMEQNSDVEGNITFYRVGRRTQREFGVDSLVEMMRHVLGLDPNQTPNLEEDVKKNIGDSYL